MANYIQNTRRRQLLDLERELDVSIEILAVAKLSRGEQDFSWVARDRAEIQRLEKEATENRRVALEAAKAASIRDADAADGLDPEEEDAMLEAEAEAEGGPEAAGDGGGEGGREGRRRGGRRRRRRRSGGLAAGNGVVQDAAATAASTPAEQVGPAEESASAAEGGTAAPDDGTGEDAGSRDGDAENGGVRRRRRRPRRRRRSGGAAQGDGVAPIEAGTAATDSHESADAAFEPTGDHTEAPVNV
jgi:ribonuclease E